MCFTPRVSCWRRFPAKKWSSRPVNDMDLELLGSAHGVPTDLLCLRWQSMPARDPNSLLQWTHLKPNDSGTCLGASGFPRSAVAPAPRRTLWMAFNLMLQFPASGWDSDAHDPTACCCETGTKHNTKRIHTTTCIAMDGSVAWLCTHHGWFHILNENTDQNVRSLTLNQNQKYKIRKWLRGGLHTHQIHNARSLRNIHNEHNCLNNCWVNFDNLNRRAGRRLVHPSMAARGQQSKKPSQLQWSGIWCAWICSRITNNYFFPIVMQWVSDCCFAV